MDKFSFKKGAQLIQSGLLEEALACFQKQSNDLSPSQLFINQYIASDIQWLLDTHDAESTAKFMVAETQLEAFFAQLPSAKGDGNEEEDKEEERLDLFFNEDGGLCKDLSKEDFSTLEFEDLSRQTGVPLCSMLFALFLDVRQRNVCRRTDFFFPGVAPASSSSQSSLNGRRKVIYLCGNSLGLQPKRTEKALALQLGKWATQGVEGHFEYPTPWLTIDETVKLSMAKIVGALPSEVVMMNTLTGNLHSMMASFYCPTDTRYKIMIEKKAFPSDIHAVKSQLLLHKQQGVDALLEVGPLSGEETLRTEEILRLIEAEGDSVALVLLSGVQYYTGQLFDMEQITLAARRKGCMVGWDLAHAVGNVPLQLHEW